jgi:hypothetical protein
MPRLRPLEDVSEQELWRAVRGLGRSPNMPGSIVGRYDIYQALLKERKRAISAKEGQGPSSQ